MAMERREKNLFREWKRKYGEQFIADGVVNEAAFDASPLPRLVFVLKEVDDCAPGFDLRSFIEAGSPKNGGHTFAPMARWVSAVRGREINFAPEEERKRILLPVAVMNLKKTTGGAITRYGALHAAVMADREFLKEQIRLYLTNPPALPVAAIRCLTCFVTSWAGCRWKIVPGRITAVWMAGVWLSVFITPMQKSADWPHVSRRPLKN